MFCNGPKTDEGDIARLGPTTITGMTILKVLFVLDHDSGRYRWFDWACQLPPYSWGRPYLRQTQEYEEVLDILYVYIYVLPSSSFLFFLDAPPVFRGFLLNNQFYDAPPVFGAFLLNNQFYMICSLLNISLLLLDVDTS